MAATRKAFQSRLPGEMGMQYGKLKVISDQVYRSPKGKAMLLTECSACGTKKPKDFNNLKSLIAGCHGCRFDRVPRWLYKRCQGAEQRCLNPRNARFMDYGGRGIGFRFASVMEMAAWVQDTLGLHREMELDRIDNDGPYAPGNLRWATKKVNTINTRKRRLSPLMHQFRQRNPEVRYADATLIRLLGLGLTEAEIVERFYKPSCKPKGVYGTFSTPDPVIASLSKG